MPFQIKWLFPHPDGISKQLEELSLIIKDIGNDGAHPSNNKPNKNDAEITIYLAHQICKLIYVMPAKINKLSQCYIDKFQQRVNTTSKQIKKAKP